MQKDEFVFSADCVINLDEFEFKDYTDTLQQFHTSLDSDTPKIQLLKQLLSADQEDVFHLPLFDPTVAMMIVKEDLLTKSDSSIEPRLFRLYLQIVEQSFFNYTCKEEVIENIFARISRPIKNLQIKLEVLLFLYKLAPSLNYLNNEDFEKLVPMLLSLSEQDYREDNDGDRFVFVVDYFLRCRAARVLIENQCSVRKNEGISAYLLFKIALWRRDTETARESLSSIKEKDSFVFLRKSVECWEKRLS